MQIVKLDGTWQVLTEEIQEAIKYKKVVRKGKVINRKKTTDKPGYKIDPKTGKEVRMTPQEIRNRKKAAKKAAKKRKGKKSQTTRNKKKSDKIRKSRNI